MRILFLLVLVLVIAQRLGDVVAMLEGEPLDGIARDVDLGHALKREDLFRIVAAGTFGAVLDSTSPQPSRLSNPTTNASRCGSISTSGGLKDGSSTSTRLLVTSVDAAGRAAFLQKRRGDVDRLEVAKNAPRTAAANSSELRTR